MMRNKKVLIKTAAKRPVRRVVVPVNRCSGRTVQIRISHENKAILEAIQDKLEVLYDKEMVDLGIKSLTIDGAITKVLMTALIVWSLPATMLEADSNYLRVMRAADGNDNKKEE